MKKKIMGFGVLILSLLVLSCGYHFSSGGENIDSAVKLIYVDNLANRTSEANAENIFRNALNNRFRIASRFQLAADRDQADAVLKGSIGGLAKSYLSYSTSDIAQEERVTVVLDLTFETRDKGVIWSNHNFTWFADYLVSQNNPAITDANRRAAIQKLADEAADRIFRSIMSGF